MRLGDFVDIIEGQPRPSKKKTKKRILKTDEQETGVPMETVIEEEVPQAEGQFPDSPKSEDGPLEIGTMREPNKTILEVPREFFTQMMATMKAM
ncbi:hypothetical protein R1flu_027987 [Riccia fluitans]|uniref:Uncharacterized protein n=1 Tax=Riccia fluitans TaxID=41844 RepID=A0ABD1XKD2_9MARC